MGFLKCCKVHLAAMASKETGIGKPVALWMSIFQMLAVGDYIRIGFRLVGFGLYFDPADGDFFIVTGR